MRAIAILNRELRWCGDSFEYEADKKHARVIVEEMGLSAESTGLTMPCVREEANGG